MDAFELNKIAGATLAALLTVFGLKVFYEIALPHHKPAKPGYSIPVTAAKPGAPAAAPAAFDPKAVVALVAKATPANGQEVFRACQACHTVEKGGGVKTGPNLFGIVGRKVGGVAGFQYSPDFTGKTTSWTYEELAKFLHNPKGYAPNTKMVFRGVEDPAELADLISYLRSLADSPAPLPK